ncbi:LytTR family transcriptional regulator DNA-binding domain-containing protein [Sorangium sp. So ce693]
MPATDPELAEETLGRLAKLFRYSLEGSERHVVPLGDEIANVTDYLEVETIRFRERLRVAILVDPALHSIKVPPMLLQPLVENAVKHGASRRVEGGTLPLRAELAGDDLLLFVLDDGPGPDGSSHRGTGTSLLDLRERLRLLLVTRFRADDKYTAFLFDGEEHLLRESLSTLEERLAPFGFVRVHRAELVRANAVRALTPDAGGALLHLSDGQTVTVSRRSLPALKQLLGLR